MNVKIGFQFNLKDFKKTGKTVAEYYIMPCAFTKIFFNCEQFEVVDGEVKLPAIAIGEWEITNARIYNTSSKGMAEYPCEYVNKYFENCAFLDEIQEFAKKLEAPAKEEKAPKVEKTPKTEKATKEEEAK